VPQCCNVSMAIPTFSNRIAHGKGSSLALLLLWRLGDLSELWGVRHYSSDVLCTLHAFLCLKLNRPFELLGHQTGARYHVIHNMIGHAYEDCLFGSHQTLGTCRAQRDPATPDAWEGHPKREKERMRQHLRHVHHLSWCCRESHNFALLTTLSTPAGLPQVA
jgi:hypothetical protein